MTHEGIPIDGLVLVCDGAKALFLKNEGRPHKSHLTTVEFFNEPHPAAHDLGTERPGRVYQSFSSARSTSEERDLHNEAEIAFLIKIAGELDRMVTADAIRAVILVAPPSALGILRKHLTPVVQSALQKEIGKDLTHLSVGEIEEHLAA